MTDTHCDKSPSPRVVLLAGGVGGAKMAEGFSQLYGETLTIIANVGDDETFYGLHVSPDIDTIIYTLSARIDRKQGWGVKEDSLKALDVLRDLGAPVWMKLGDADFGLHIWRSQKLASGATLSEVTQEAATRFGIRARIIPVTNSRLRTKLRTDDGWMDFQQWFVGARCSPRVLEIQYEGAEAATLDPDALHAIVQADLIVIAPSNPLLSIEPMLAVKTLRTALASSNAPRIAVSPLIGGKAIKGPLAKLFADLKLPAGSAGVAERYAGLIDAIVVDSNDHNDIGKINASGVQTLATDILIPEPKEAKRLAEETVNFGKTLQTSRRPRT